MNSFKTILLIIFAFILTSNAGAQEEESIVYDSNAIDIRPITKESLEKLKADPEMDYGQSPAAVNLWERFKRWFLNWLNRLIGAAVSASWSTFLIIILAILSMVYVIMRLLKVDAFGMVYSGAKTSPGYGVLDEDIHTMDFEKMINDALQHKQFRLAIRLLFLQSLKLLADQHHILWKPGKTNHDYLQELKAGHLKAGFNDLSFYFEYAWYGNFTVNETMYQKVAKIFNHWKAGM